MKQSSDIWRAFSTFALVCTLTLAGALAGCSESETVSEPVQAEGAPSPLLFEITNSDGGVEGWMLGTIHALPDGTKWRTPTIDRVIEEADRLLVEVPGLNNETSVMATFRRLATTPDLGPLSQRITPELRGPLAEMIELSAIPPAQFHDTESWAAAIMLSRVGAVGKPRNGVDRIVLHEFRGRDVYGFETPGLQLGVFDQLSPKDQRDLLEGTVLEWLASRETPGHLTQAWLEGNIEALEDATTSGIMADAELRSALLTGRNQNWFPTLLANLRSSDRLLVAVGAAHIVGPDGLPAMLEAEGYTVTRLH